jgi:hypothetical protein
MALLFPDPERARGNKGKSTETGGFFEARANGEEMTDQEG